MLGLIKPVSSTNWFCVAANFCTILSMLIICDTTQINSEPVAVPPAARIESDLRTGPGFLGGSAGGVVAGAGVLFNGIFLISSL